MRHRFPDVHADQHVAVSQSLPSGGAAGTDFFDHHAAVVAALKLFEVAGIDRRESQTEHIPGQIFIGGRLEPASRPAPELTFTA